jgi:hypothetical protein
MDYLMRKNAASKRGIQRTKFSSEFFTYWEYFFQLGTGVRYIINANAAAPTKVIGILWLTKHSLNFLVTDVVIFMWFVVQKFVT